MGSTCWYLPSHDLTTLVPPDTLVACTRAFSYSYDVTAPSGLTSPSSAARPTGFFM